MNHVAVLVDSVCDLSAQQAEALGVHIFPLHLAFDHAVWADHLELTPREMFQRIEAGAPLPVLLPLTIDRYMAQVNHLLASHDHVFAIHSGPGIGQNYAFAARTISRLTERVTVFNAGNTSVGMALQAERAARLLREGLAPAEAARLLTAIQPHQTTLLCLSTVDHLRRNRRISVPAALIAGWRRIKPIFHVRGGQITLLRAPEGERAALNAMKTALYDHALKYPRSRVMYATNGSELMLSELRAYGRSLGLEEVLVAQIGAAFSAFAGPDVYGFCAEPLTLPGPGEG